jgi:hypothetical protein
MQVPAANSDRKTSSILPWSYSSLQAYETCPRRFKITKVQKLVREQMTASTTWGNDVHKALELAVRGTNGLIPKFAPYAPLVKLIREAEGQVEAERKFALTRAFTPTDYWAPDAWVRGKADVTITRQRTGFLFDYKTGKPKEDSDQLNLFAAVLLAEKPFLNRVATAYLWLGNDRVDPAVVDRTQAPIIWQGFVGRVQRMAKSAENDDFPPRPSGLCKDYCPVGKKLCEHCGRP